MICHHFYNILLEVSELSLSQVGEEITQRCECQEAGITGDHPRGCLPQLYLIFPLSLGLIEWLIHSWDSN